MTERVLNRRIWALFITGLLLSVFSAASVAQSTPIDDPASEGRIEIPLSGTANVRRIDGLSASPSRLGFELVQIGGSSRGTVNLRHAGEASSAPILIGAVSLFGLDADEFATDFNGFATLAPGESLPIDVTFTPVLPGEKVAGLRFDIDGSTSPYVVLFEGSARFPLSSTLELSSSVVAFGEVLTDDSETQFVELRNEGVPEAPPITVSAVQLSGDTPEVFTTTFAPTTLAPGESATLSITLATPVEGTKSAMLEVMHDGNNPTAELMLEGTVVEPLAIPVNFTKSTLDTAQQITRGTSIQFGPDGKLYVSEMDGPIHVFEVTREGKNDYSANKLETINLIKNVQNHNDNGTVNGGLNKRLLTGFTVVGTAATPIIYAASSDPRQAAGPSGNDSNLDTNSGILHKLTKTGGGWNKQDLLRGLPRSEENHVANGIQLRGNKILLITGGHTNQGVPSNNFAELAEYALSGALLEIDLGKLGNPPYDLPTLDDEDRAGVNDQNDPFGGNDGKNQAKLVAGGPISLHSTGLRNAYDLVITEAGQLYTFDNGPNSGWGGSPGANCLNTINNGGSTSPDSLQLLKPGSYHGHPNPTRGNTSNTFNDDNPQSPVEIAADPKQCQYKASGSDGALTTIGSSTNGLDEYTASNFGGAMKGDLIVMSFNKVVYRLQLNGSGNNVTSKSQLMTNVGDVPLDLTTQGDDEVFPGTIWVVDNKGKSITVLEPADY